MRAYSYPRLVIDGLHIIRLLNRDCSIFVTVEFDDGCVLAGPPGDVPRVVRCYQVNLSVRRPVGVDGLHRRVLIQVGGQQRRVLRRVELIFVIGFKDDACCQRVGGSCTAASYHNLGRVDVVRGSCCADIPYGLSL